MNMYIYILRSYNEHYPLNHHHQGQYVANPGNQGLSVYAWQTVGNVVGLFTSMVISLSFIYTYGIYMYICMFTYTCVIFYVEQLDNVVGLFTSMVCICIFRNLYINIFIYLYIYYMCIYIICVYIYICSYILIYIYMYIYIYAWQTVGNVVRLFTSMVCLCIFIYINVFLCLYIDIFIYLCIYIFIYLYIYIFIYLYI
jgi:hypothetical protein